MFRAFIFPGQGTQYVGMGSDLHDSFKLAKNRYACASELLGYNLAQISFQGPEDQLCKTQFTQPAIFVHSVIIDEILRENGIKPHAVAGHSLGEFSALVSAGSLSFEDALKIVKVRSSAMASAGDAITGAMAAIMDADENQLKSICTQDGIVVPANMNAPGQVVISGEISAIENAINTARKMGIRRAVKLNVTGAFHSPLMAEAREPLQEVMNSVNFQDATVPVYQNVNAEAITDSHRICQNLIQQLENPVLWSETILNMKKNGITEFIEAGPGKVLSGLNHRIIPGITSHNFDKMEHLNFCEIL